MGYYIGSFNLRDFNYSNISSDGTNEKLKRDFELIAKIIVDQGFDVVALQEVNAISPLNHLKMILNRYSNFSRQYECAFGEGMPGQQNSRDPERYAFIWNSKRLRLVHTKRNNNPGYYSNAGAIGLIRPPYIGRFTARGMRGGTNFELRLINTHIKYAHHEEEKIAEFDVLVKQVLPRICDWQELSEEGEIMPAYTFLLGDYNIALNKGPQATYAIQAETESNYTGRRRKYRTVQEEKTTLRSKSDNYGTIEECYLNNYDHFTYETDLDFKLLLVPLRVEALSQYSLKNGNPAEKLEDYRTRVSDHVPIKMRVDLK